LSLKLTGPGISLRPLEASDFESLYSAASDPEIWRQHSETGRWKRDNFKVFFDKALNSGGAHAIIENASGAVIGSSRYYDFDVSHKQVFIGYTFVAPRLWGGELNSELKKLMIGHAFTFADRVLFHTSEQNIRSQRSLEKLGAVRRKDLVMPPDLGGATRVEYSLTKGQWNQRHPEDASS